MIDTDSYIPPQQSERVAAQYGSEAFTNANSVTPNDHHLEAFARHGVTSTAINDYEAAARVEATTAAHFATWEREVKSPETDHLEHLMAAIEAMTFKEIVGDIAGVTQAVSRNHIAS